VSRDEEEEEVESQEEPEAYRVLLDGVWKLEDLYEFPHALSQCYAFIYCLDSPLHARDRNRINDALAGYPWRGGYSYVNIYTVLQNQVPVLERPTIKAISYASPGWLDIFLNVDVAIQVAKSVGILAGSAIAAAKAYASVMKSLSQVAVDRKRAQLQEMQLSQAQHKTFVSMCEDMAKFLGFKNVKELHQRTGNSEISLKLLAAHYRRTSKLMEFVKEGKIELPEKVDC
jgi:hypothetical protein